MYQEYLWYFLIYACLGWMVEVCYAAATSGKIVNRGFLNGPVCPIYGAGMSVVVWCLTPLQQKPGLFFLGAVALTSLIELLTGFVLEKLFHHRWWDYSNVPFNIGGYICLKFSLAWGCACVLALDMVHPPVRRFVEFLPAPVSTVLLCVLYAVLFADLAATLRTIARLNRRLGQIDDVAEKLRALSNDMTQDLSEGTFAAMDKGADLAQRSALVKDELRRRGLEWRAGVLQRIDEAKENLSESREALQTLRETAAGAVELERLGRMAKRQARIDELVAQQAALLDKTNFGTQRMLRAFSDMRSTLHYDALEDLKRHMK